MLYSSFVVKFSQTKDPEKMCKTLVSDLSVQLEDPTWKPVYGEIEFECSHWSVFENAIDMAHIHYLHSDSFGNKVSSLSHAAEN